MGVLGILSKLMQSRWSGERMPPEAGGSRGAVALVAMYLQDTQPEQTWGPHRPAGCGGSSSVAAAPSSCWNLNQEMQEAVQGTGRRLRQTCSTHRVLSQSTISFERQLQQTMKVGWLRKMHMTYDPLLLRMLWALQCDTRRYCHLISRYSVIKCAS